MVRTDDSPGSTIAGGFVAIPVAGLMATWRACATRPLVRGDFRTWLAAHEMLARRCAIEPDRMARFGVAELARLLGGLSQRRVKASLGRLAEAGFIVFGPDRIEFPPADEPDQPLDVIGGGRGSVYLPRRILRHLAANDTRPALIATALAVLLRCLSRRRSGFDGRGRFKASWVSERFAINLRRVKAARAEFLRLGWIKSEPSDQRAENRWGRVFQIDLQWNSTQGAVLPPPPGVDRRGFATPSFNQDPLREGNQHQEPAPQAGPGFRIEAAQEPETRPPTPPVDPQPRALPPAPVPAPVAAPVPAPVPVPTDLPSPRLQDIRSEDLGSVPRLLELYGQAIRRGLVGSSEADRLKFVALAEHARCVGKTNPAGLFAALLRRGAWAYITQAEEDGASRKLKAHLWGDRPAGSSPVSNSRPVKELSTDARTVREVMRALAAAGYRGDGYPQLRRHDASWTRARWDTALSELSGSDQTFSARSNFTG